MPDHEIEDCSNPPHMNTVEGELALLLMGELELAQVYTVVPITRGVTFMTHAVPVLVKVWAVPFLM
jgi:hypothetical protein